MRVLLHVLGVAGVLVQVQTCMQFDYNFHYERDVKLALGRQGMWPGVRWSPVRFCFLVTGELLWHNPSWAYFVYQRSDLAGWHRLVNFADRSSLACFSTICVSLATLRCSPCGWSPRQVLRYVICSMRKWIYAKHEKENHNRVYKKHF